jgi:hypothetical protein
VQKEEEKGQEEEDFSWFSGKYSVMVFSCIKFQFSSESFVKDFFFTKKI